jgi:23S rRNA pseudouridine2605 synthase
MGKDPSAERVRLNKYLADCGVASRRKADELMTEGQVMVNGKKVFELGTRVDPLRDKILVSGKPVRAPSHKVYIMFHKPKNVVTTMEDPLGRPTIAEFFNRLPVRVFPVGRLDWDTEGLMLLTNDGDFSQRINHPGEEVPKTYMAKVSGKPSDEALQRLVRGVSIIGGRVQALHVERIKRGADKYDWIKIVVGEGKNRQVRRMFEKIGFDVLKLQRVAVGRLRLGTLKRGEFVFLTEQGIAKIFQKEPMAQKQSRSDKAAPRHLNPRARSAKTKMHQEKARGMKPRKRQGPFDRQNRGAFKAQ